MYIWFFGYFPTFFRTCSVRGSLLMCCVWQVQHNLCYWTCPKLGSNDSRVKLFLDTFSNWLAIQPECRRNVYVRAHARAQLVLHIFERYRKVDTKMVSKSRGIWLNLSQVTFPSGHISVDLSQVTFPSGHISFDMSQVTFSSGHI